MRIRHAAFMLTALGLSSPSWGQAPAEPAQEAGLASFLAKYPVKLGGFIKFDASWDDSRLSEGNFARWVLSEGENKNDAQFNMTARQSRFWLELGGPKLEGLTTSGYLEIDFYGGGDENKNLPMLRRCFLKLHWEELDFSVLAGQDMDLISRMVLPTVNYTVGWWVGNIGYRRPQLTLSKGFTMDDMRLLAELAAVRTIGDAKGDPPFTPRDTGEDAGFPTLQSRIALSLPLIHETKKATFAAYGHWGAEEYDIAANGNSRTFQTYSVGFEADLPLCDILTLQANAWTGANLNAYLGGIGQGVNADLEKEIISRGGWAALKATPFDALTLHAGGGVDAPRKSYLAAGGRSKNLFAFGNAWYDINAAVKAGLELSYWKTEYKGLDAGEALRAQFSMMFNF